MHALLASKLTSAVRATLSCIMISSFFVQSLYLTIYKINIWRRFFVWKDESKIRANNFSCGFQANWYRASQYCRYHGMHLASIASQEENDRLEKHIKDFGLGHEHFWTSGTDQAEEGTFFWMANGRPITFENWNVGEPNNFRCVHSRCSVIYRKTLFFARNEVFDRVWRKHESTMRLVTDTRTARKNTASSCGIGMARDWSGTTVRAVSRPFSFARCNDRSIQLRDWHESSKIIDPPDWIRDTTSIYYLIESSSQLAIARSIPLHRGHRTK